MGTIAYVAPELLEGKPSGTTDQYCLAISYYELRTGLLPYLQETASAVMKAVIEGDLDFSKVPEAEQAVLRHRHGQGPRRAVPLGRGHGRGPPRGDGHGPRPDAGLGAGPAPRAIAGGRDAQDDRNPRPAGSRRRRRLAGRQPGRPPADSAVSWPGPTTTTSRRSSRQRALKPPDPEVEQARKLAALLSQAADLAAASDWHSAQAEVRRGPGRRSRQSPGAAHAGQVRAAAGAVRRRRGLPPQGRSRPTPTPPGPSSRSLPPWGRRR